VDDVELGQSPGDYARDHAAVTPLVVCFEAEQARRRRRE
jgi:hypothetical protein